MDQPAQVDEEAPHILQPLAQVWRAVDVLLLYFAGT